MVTELDMIHLREVREDSAGSPVLMDSIDDAKKTITFFHPNCMYRMSFEEAKTHLQNKKMADELVDRVCLDLVRETGELYRPQFIKDVLKANGIDLTKLPISNSREVLENAVRNLGSIQPYEVMRTTLGMEQNGKIVTFCPSDSYRNPVDRFKLYSV